MNFKKLKKVILIVILFVMMSALQVQASTRDIIFNSDFYANVNSDIRKAHGYDVNKLNEHFNNYGMAEGRKASVVFDVKYYVQNNKDLERAFKTKKGYNYKAAFNHFVNNGIREERALSPIYDAKYYIENNKDVAKAFKTKNGYNYQAILNHFLNNGMREGRSASKDFDVKHYVANNKDLQRAFRISSNKYDYVALFNHYMTRGIHEKRVINAHVYGKATIALPATCETPGKSVRKCTVCSSKIEDPIPALDHLIKTDPKEAPTCTKPGKTEGAHCERCGDILQPQETIPALKHDFEVKEPATCTASAVIVCKNDGCEYAEGISADKVADQLTEEQKTEFLAQKHDFEVKAPATCTASAVIVCKNDGCEYAEGISADKVADQLTEEQKTEFLEKGHNFEAKEPKTCTVSAIVVCKNAGCEYAEGISADEVADKLTEEQKTEFLKGHDFENGTEIKQLRKDPTCIAKGKIVTKCKNCYALHTEYPDVDTVNGHKYPAQAYPCVEEKVTCELCKNAEYTYSVTEEHTVPEGIECDATVYTCEGCHNEIEREAGNHTEPANIECDATSYTCDVCHKKDITREARTHTEPADIDCDATEYTCDVCHKEHIEREAGTHTEPEGLGCREKNYTCAKCGKPATREAKKHVIPEGIDCTATEYTCEVCGKTVSRQAGTHKFTKIPLTESEDEVLLYCETCGHSEGVKMKLEEPKKLSLSNVSPEEIYYANINKNMEAIDVAKDGDTITVTQTAEMDSYNNGHATGKWFGILVDLGINKENLTTTGSYGIEASDKADAAKWGATNDNQVIIWLTDEDCGENGITLEFKDSVSEAKKNVTVKFVPLASEDVTTPDANS